MRSAWAIAVGVASASFLTASYVVAARTDGIDDLAKEIQGKRPEEVRALIVARLGQPDRDIGSGEHIEQWDAEGGVLTFHPGRGPTFSKAGTIRRLIRTNNPAARCLFGGYEMTTAPDPANHGNCFWLGNLTLTADGKYQYTDSGSNRDQRAGQDQNQFIRHPNGTARVAYARGVSATTRLEDLPEGARVATVVFSSPGATESRSFDLVVDSQNMRLLFKGPDGLPFRMEKGWVNYWE